jgi:hypothetical protein
MKLAMIAADYTPGKADYLRRDTVAWHRTGRMDSLLATGITPWSPLIKALAGLRCARGFVRKRIS